jgi:hypothetical protein
MEQKPENLYRKARLYLKDLVLGEEWGRRFVAGWV